MITAYLELYFQVNEIDAAKQVPILLSSIRAKTYELLLKPDGSEGPEREDTKGADDCSEKSFRTSAHCDSRIMASFSPQRASHRRNYVAELRRLTTHCKFEDTTDYLEESLCDCFIFGLRTESTRKQLFTEKNLTFANLKAFEIAKREDTAMKMRNSRTGRYPELYTLWRHQSLVKRHVTVVVRLTKASEYRFKEATWRG